MSFYLKSLRALHEADAPPPALMNPDYWAFIAARSTDERLLRGGTAVLGELLRQIERRGVRDNELPFDHEDIEQLVIDWAWIPALDRTFLTWAFRLSTLKTLHLSRNTGLEDISPLSGLWQLRELHLADTKVKDLTPLAGLSQLQKLFLYHTKVEDITPLSGLSQLQKLFLYNTQVEDITPLSGLSQLETLFLSNTKVSDLTPLSGLSRLQWLNLRNTKVSDLTPLSGLSQLRTLGLVGAPVSPGQVAALQTALPQCRIAR